MVFNSFSYLIFFPVVAITFFLLPKKYQWGFLLFVSCVFYSYFIPSYLLILFLVISIDFFAAKLIYKTKGVKRKIYLLTSILSNVLILVLFKYFNFLNINLHLLGEFLGWNYPLTLLSFVLPIGLSFHTFQSLSYIIEVYKRKQKPEKSYGIYALYVMFFPQLVAGPIERPQHMLHQFKERKVFDYKRVSDGLKLIVWGMFKKIVIADRLAVFVDTVYRDPTQFGGISFLMTAIFFSFQIYCDFSGYTDIARGSAQVLGFKLMENFKAPLFAKNISEFWQRWHISLSSWFRDYVYIPLGGNRVSNLKWARNILIVFLLSGVWHGADWTFVIWGILHGVLIVLTVILLKFSLFKIPDLIGKSLGIFITFLFVSLSWIFFRAESLNNATYILTHLNKGILDYFELIHKSLSQLLTGNNISNFIPELTRPFLLGLSKWEFFISIFLIMLLLLVHKYEREDLLIQKLNNFSYPARVLISVLLISLILNLGVLKEIPFIYFQF